MRGGRMGGLGRGRWSGGLWEGGVRGFGSGWGCRCCCRLRRRHLFDGTSGVMVCRMESWLGQERGTIARGSTDVEPSQSASEEARPLPKPYSQSPRRPVPWFLQVPPRPPDHRESFSSPRTSSTVCSKLTARPRRDPSNKTRPPKALLHLSAMSSTPSALPLQSTSTLPPSSPIELSPPAPSNPTRPLSPRADSDSQIPRLRHAVDTEIAGCACGSVEPGKKGEVLGMSAGEAGRAARKWEDAKRGRKSLDGGVGMRVGGLGAHGGGEGREESGFDRFGRPSEESLRGAFVLSL